MLSSYADPHPLADTRAQLLQAMLPNIVFDGWSPSALNQAAETTGLGTDAAAAAFPQGAVDALLLFLRHGDAATESAIRALPLESMKVRAKIEEGVMVRLRWALQYREAVRSGLVALAAPQHAPMALRSLYDTVDTIWHAIGDRSTDMNFYSKRALLAGVYSSTLVVWLDDTTEDLAITRAFLQRRIGNVMQIEKAKGWFKQQWSRLSSEAGKFSPRRRA